ncbi:hypothetical protein P4679_30740 [Priestia megaterium]|uniref:hypothetical protein n=1 Tax=Priestia megaterium TaxID=1404 RepID=UPI002E1A324B|nr:hypothetical protein [Priestia megaterium]
MEAIVEKVKKYNQIKMDLMKIAKCIDCCTEVEEKEFYQDVAVSYSKEMKRIKGTIEDTYGIQICNCSALSDK